MEDLSIEELLENNASFEASEERDKLLLEKAYMVAELAHKGQTRDDGTPYFEHPKRVAESLLKYENNILAQVLALLHDTLEDTNIDYEYLKKHFGYIADEVLVLTKKKGEDFQIYLKNILEFPSANPIIVKMLDRIDNIKDLKNCPDKNKIKKYIKETGDIFIPMLEDEGYKLDRSFQRIKIDLVEVTEDAKTI